MKRIFARPRLLGLLCAVAAVAAGIAYMQMAGAPPRYLFVNFAALVLGGTVWLALARASSRPIRGTGPIILALAVSLLLTALLGIRADGAARWVSLGALNVQVSLVVVPVMLVLYAREQADPVGTVGMVLAGLALALQPDRAMAGVMLAGLIARVAAKPGRLPFIAAAAAFLAFAITLIMPEALAAVPYVDRVLHTAFDIHLLAGLAVLIGAGALVVPVLGSVANLTRERAVLLTFGACWLGVVVAAALGNSPTPLVGYGGSAILGYLLSVALLPNGAIEIPQDAVGEALSVTAEGRDQPMSELRIPRLA